MALMRSQPFEEEADMADSYIADRRLYRAADGTIVEEGDPAAATLYATPGTEIPMAEAEELGLVKRAAKPADKARRGAEDKGRG